MIARLRGRALAGMLGGAAQVAHAGAVAQADEAELHRPTIETPAIDPASTSRVHEPPVDDVDDDRAIALEASDVSEVVRQQMKELFGKLWQCRYQVAMRERVSPDSLPAGQVRVRYLLEPGGGLRDVSILGLTATSPDVLTCVRQEVEAWRFPYDGSQLVRVREDVSLQPPGQRDGDRGTTDPEKAGARRR